MEWHYIVFSDASLKMHHCWKVEKQPTNRLQRRAPRPRLCFRTTVGYWVQSQSHYPKLARSAQTEGGVQDTELPGAFLQWMRQRSPPDQECSRWREKHEKSGEFIGCLDRGCPIYGAPPSALYRHIDSRVHSALRPAGI